MATIKQSVELYQNGGAVLTAGSNQILSFSNLQQGVTGEIAVNDTNNDIEWDFDETASFQGAPATLVATGIARIGVTVDLPFPIPDLTVGLSSPVQTAVMTVGGVQDLRQLYTRPAPRVNPYSTPLKGVYLCSSSTPPGGGVHGMCGWHAARSALKHEF